MAAATSDTPAAELRATSYENLSGWANDRHSLALRTFQRSCRRLSRSSSSLRAGTQTIPAARVGEVCRLALELGTAADDNTARAFFESQFEPMAVSEGGDGQGLFTGYFEPEYPGSRTPSSDYRVPIYARPNDLERITGSSGSTYGRRINGSLRPYYTRREIESGQLRGRGLEIVYLRSPVDAFFAHIQGSARIILAEGGHLKISFAAKNGHEYFPVGRALIQSGEITAENMSMQAIRSWLEAHPDQVDTLLWKNDSFIFFQESEAGEPGIGPPGAEGVGLTPGRSLAVDKRVYSYGLPMWLETTLPTRDGSRARPFNHLMVAQDTGSAITGAVRGDVFVGTGSEAGEIAGLMKQEGRLVVLVPRRSAVPQSVAPGAAPAPEQAPAASSTRDDEPLK